MTTSEDDKNIISIVKQKESADGRIKAANENETEGDLIRGKKRRISQDSSRASEQSAAQQTTTDGEIKQMSVTDQHTHKNTHLDFLPGFT